MELYLSFRKLLCSIQLDSSGNSTCLEIPLRFFCNFIKNQKRVTYFDFNSDLWQQLVSASNFSKNAIN